MNFKKEMKCQIITKKRIATQKTSRSFCVSVFLLTCSLIPAVTFAGVNPEQGIVTTQQQAVKVTGTVVDEFGETIIGANIMEKGTGNGTITDENGNFSINVSPGATLTITYIGYLPLHINVEAGKNDYAVILREDTQSLDEVVVIGYGVQKKKLVTGATVQVSGNDIQKLSTTSVFTAMQSQTPGVSISQNSGQPGEGFKVALRGIGTIGNYTPLYVIDGVAGGDINNLNPSDIESIDVLKDAASAAIYGARAANGVILVTTKQGKSEKIQVSYDGYFGVQNVYKMPSLLNVRQYMAIMDEMNFNEGLNPYKWENYLGPYYESALNGSWKGTNWLDEIRNKNAPIQNHSFNLIGGSEISRFSLGVSYTSQEGILGKPVQSNYDRLTVRLNSDHILWKSGHLDIIKIGENLNYTYGTKQGIGIGNQYGNDISNMLRGAPVMPVYNSAGEYFGLADKDEMGLTGYDSLILNPIALMVYERGYNTSKNHTLNMSVNIQVQPVKNLIFKSQFGYKMTASSYRSLAQAYRLASTTIRNVATIDQNGSLGWNYTWENTLNYKLSADMHHIDFLGGQSIEKWGMGESWGATNGDPLFNDYKHAYLGTTQGIVTGVTTVDGAPWDQGRLASFFGRVNYDWNETYLASLIMRADGSSNFARGKRWGYFPSLSAGWVLTNESFMESAASWLNFLKLRASWGQNGNCNIPNFQYLATISFDATAAYSFGNTKDSQTTGGYANKLPNPDVTWETSEQVDVGVDARFLNTRLGMVFDWYIKTTKDWLLKAPILGSYGMGNDGAPYINGGDIENKGFEVALNWNDRAGKDFSYGVSANLSYNENKVTHIANDEGLIPGKTHALTQGTTEMYRAQVGYPVGYFYGYKTEGVFQNQADINAWKAAGKGIIQTNVQPGDLKFSDRDNNGVIDEKDKTQIGNPHPKIRTGFGFNIGYKGVDLNVTTYGAFGHQIAKNYRKFADSRCENFTTEVYERWHGEGTSDKWPRLTAGSNANYMNISDIYIENGNFLRLQNITLGYEFKRLFPKAPFAQARIYFTAQNLFTITGYSGMDPEVGYSPTDNDGTDTWASGLDLGFYPIPRTYLFGVNLKF
jgi:TonB-linked SusC/RagA family outer membrane protein